MMDLSQINMNEIHLTNQKLVMLNLVPFNPVYFISDTMGAFGVKTLFENFQSAILLPGTNEEHVIHEDDEEYKGVLPFPIDLKNYSAKVVAEQNEEYLLVLDIQLCPELVNIFNTNIIFYGWVPKTQVRLINIVHDNELYTVQ